MSKTVAYLFLAAGMGWTSYLAAPAVILSTVHLAQGQPADFTARDWANLGGFAIFAGAMYGLHRQTLVQFRDDLKEERSARERLTIALADNTAAMNLQTATMTKKG